MRKRKGSESQELYRLIQGERGPFYPLCVYCGAPATCRDHVPPLSRIDDYRALRLRRELFLLVPSCDNCNLLLGSTLQTNIFERIEYLKDILSRKHKKKLDRAEWDDDEVLELGRYLRSFVAVETAKDLNTRKRIEYYGGADAIADLLRV